MRNRLGSWKLHKESHGQRCLNPINLLPIVLSAVLNFRRILASNLSFARDKTLHHPTEVLIQDNQETQAAAIEVYGFALEEKLSTVLSNAYRVTINLSVSHVFPFLLRFVRLLDELEILYAVVMVVVAPCFTS